MSLHCIVWCCKVLYCWLRRAGCISQDTYLLYGYCGYCEYCKCCGYFRYSTERNHSPGWTTKCCIIHSLLSCCCVSFSVILWIFIHFCPAAAALYFLFRNRSGRCGEANWGNLTWTLGPGEGREDHQHKYCLSCLPCPFFYFHVIVFCRLSLYLYFCWSGYDSSKCVKGKKSPFVSVL